MHTVPLLDHLKTQERQLHKGNELQRKARNSKCNKYLEEDPNLKRWYNNLRRGSAYTAEIYLRRLCAFCAKLALTPEEFRKLPKNVIEEKAQGYINELEEYARPDGGRYAPQYVKSNLKAIKSWADWNGKKITKRIRIANEGETPTLEGEVSPTREELSQLLCAPTTSLRTRASVAIIAFTGSRPEVQGDKNGQDGLRIGDIPDLKIVEEEGGGKQAEAGFAQIPALIVVRGTISKTRRQYFTFLPEEGCAILKRYLDERITYGEKLTPGSPVISAVRRKAGHAGTG